MTEAILVTRSGKGKIRNSGFAERMITREERERGGERRVERRRFGLEQFLMKFPVTLNPRKLAAGVQNQVRGLRRRSNRKRNDKGGGVFEGELDGAVGGERREERRNRGRNRGGAFRERKREGEGERMGVGEGERE